MRIFGSVTARELFKRFGCSEKLYYEAVKPLIHAGLFAPPEQCSAAATLGMLYYYILAHQVIFIHILLIFDTKLTKLCSSSLVRTYDFMVKFQKKSP